jgi:site-specific DNA-methyltransferase (adenine-specific)
LGRTITNDWDDITSIGSGEELGYPTQKPLALLERIINVSSNPGNIVLDPFCGCGTVVHAAHKLERPWIGIDITHLAISLIEKRLKDAFPGIAYEVYGTPKDVDGAKALATANKCQFQWWAISLVNAVPSVGYTNGADTDINGIIYFTSHRKTTERAIVSVKSGAGVSVREIHDFSHVVDREQAKIGIFITLTSPEAPIKIEVSRMGFYETELGKYPKIQMFTIEELFSGEKPNIPLVDTAAFRKTKLEDIKSKKQGILF